ncbi:MAG: alanine racemase [Treponema sp.]|jgi:alanine racemase|nr:alanine racemase [Treponema sp.]
MRTRAIIHLNHFKENVNSVRRRIGKDRHICVSVKADAYGHGALRIAKASIEAGAYCLGVASVSEGSELRRGGIKAPILLFSQPQPKEIADIIKANLTIFISDTEFADVLNERAKAAKVKLNVHLKIDTGMGRLGCSAKEAVALARHIKKRKALKLTGTATHFAVSDSPNRRDIDYTKAQLSRFKRAVNAIRNEGINPGIVHAANSGAIILHPASWFDMVRPGILLYGYKTVEEYEAPLDYLKKLSRLKSLKIEPVMELRGKISLIKKIKKGESVSYGRTWSAGKDTFIGILTTGYADGFPRLASNRWQIVIGGKVYPLVGRVTMDQCCVNLGKKPDVRRWDEAIIFGSDIYPTEPDSQVIRQSAAALAEVVGTIPYEITCNINKRVPRVYVTS